MTAERDEYLAVLKALYDYEPTSEDELSIKENQLLFLVERTDEEWWKVRHKSDSQDEDTAPPGLVPASYVEEAEPISAVKALYDYDAAAVGELSVAEGEALLVYDKDEEWLLVKTERDGGKVGYVPGNYVEESTRGDEPVENEASRIVVPDSPPQRPVSTYIDPADRVAATAEKTKVDDINTWAVSEVDKKGKKKKGTLGVGNGAIFFASESDKTPVQKWQTSAIEDIKVEKSKHVHLDIGGPNPVNLHFNVGTKDAADAIVKKLQASKSFSVGSSLSQSTSPPPTTTNSTVPSPPPLLVNIPGTGSKPNKNGASVHFAQTPAVIPLPDTPVDAEYEEDDDPAKGDMGLALYDFTADGEDELSVREGERLIILDRESSEEWWKCRKMDGAEGVVPASYIETTNNVPEATQDGEDEVSEARNRAVHEEEEREAAERAAAEAEVLAAQKREHAEEERYRKKQEADRRAKAAAAAKAEKERRNREALEREARTAQEREAAEVRHADENRRNRDSTKAREGDESGRRTSKLLESPEARPKFPNAEKTRTWHDRSGQWRTDAEFLGISKGKIRLHKVNGVIIEVPPEKISTDDVLYIEGITKQNLGSHTRVRSKDDDDVPLGSLSSKATRPTLQSKAASTVDWFEFFLNAGCEVDDCTRYASSFERDKIDEVILPDIKESTLRSLGLREGDIIRVMKAIEKRKPKGASSDDALKGQLARDEELAKVLQAEEESGSSQRRPNTTSPAPNIFTTPGGALKPRRGRPQPRGSAPLVNVDVNSIASASDQISSAASPLVGSPSAGRASPANISNPKRAPSTQPSGFDDDAWTNRPSSTKPATVASPAPPALPPAPPAPPAPTPPVPSSVPPAAVAAAQVPLPTSTSTTSNLSNQGSGQFEILAKIGQLRPSPAPQPAILGTTSQVVSPPPRGFHSGLGVGPSPVPIGQHLQNQQSGLYAQQTQLGPRGPLAPVPANQGLLNPLIPTNTGFNQFVPTKPPSNPSFQPPVQTSFLSAPPVGFGHNGPLIPQQTGFPIVAPQQTGTFSSISSQPTGFGPSGFGGVGLPNFLPPNGFGGVQPHPTGFNPSFSQPILNSGTLAPASGTLQKDHSPANVFAQMKSGTFGEESGPQPADKYEALRSQPINAVYQQNGFPIQGPYGGF